jgi:hypothetical protein
MMIRTRPVMRRLAAVLGVAAAALSIGVSTASADLVHDGVRKCEWDATWQVTINPTGSSYADVTYVPTPSALNALCRRADAKVSGDGNLDLQTYDVSPAYTVRLDLLGAALTGSTAFAGTGTYNNGTVITGPVTIASDSLTAALQASTTLGSNGSAQSTEVHTPQGTCGLNCYRTHVVAVWAAAYSS